MTSRTVLWQKERWRRGLSVIHLVMENQRSGPRVLEKTTPAADTVKDPTRMIVLMSYRVSNK